MQVLLAIGLIWLVCVMIKYLVEALQGRSHTGTSPRSYRTPSSGPVKTKKDPNVYRPSKVSRAASPQGILFHDYSAGTTLPTDQEIKDLVDALTGAPLQLTLGLYQCQRCKVFYQTHSFEVIRSENGGRCVSCLNTEIVGVAGGRKQRGQNADVSVVTLQNYRHSVGHVITFEGVVCKVLRSRRGADYAVMFEDKTWSRGLKMVVFRGDVRQIGGAQFVYSLVGRRVRVRGLMMHHTTFGYEIIISDRAMILSVQ